MAALTLRRAAKGDGRASRTNEAETNMKDLDEELPEFYASPVDFMDCIPGNFDGPEGEDVVIVTIARGFEVEQLAFRMRDGRQLVAKVLVALATSGDQQAEKLLEDRFGADEDGDYVWPKDEGQ